MFKSSFVPFSMMGEDQKEKIDIQIALALSALKEIYAEPMAAKENLMKTNFKVASTALNFVGRLLQAESAMAQAVATIGDRANKSEYFREIVIKNLPEIQLPPRPLVLKK